MDSRRWFIIAPAVSVIIVFILYTTSSIKLEDLAQVGLLPILSASLLSSFRLFIQGVRFYLLARGLGQNFKGGFWESSGMKVGSEFIALTTPTYVGGEVIRIAWLQSKGVDSGRATWVAAMEVYNDVFVGGFVALTSAVFAWLLGSQALAIAIATVSCATVLFFLLFLTYPTRKGFKIPAWLGKLLVRYLGEKKVEKINSQLEGFSASYRLAAGELTQRTFIPVLAGSFMLTIIIASSTGAALWIILLALDAPVSFFVALMTVYAALALGSLPVTLAGSGLSEVGTYAYLSSVLGLSLWNAVLVWRMISYHLPLAVTGIVFAVFLSRKLRSKAQT